MAKELPYFKFEPNQWDNGNIQICTREDKGLFIDLCSMYWSRLGNLPLKLAIQKLCGGNANAFNALIDEGLFTVIDNDICIDFLNEQLSEFEDKSERNRQIALDGWRKRRSKTKETKKISERNANAFNSQSERNAIREEEKREEEIKDIFSFKTFLQVLGVQEPYLSDWLKVRKTKKASNTESALNGFLTNCKKANMHPNRVVQICAENSWSGFKPEYLQGNGFSSDKKPVVYKPEIPKH